MSVRRALDPAGNSMVESGWEAEHKSEKRSTHELSSCLLELSRLVRGIAFYPDGDPHRCELLDRTFAAWDNELERCGELQLCADDGRIAIEGLDETLDGVHIEHLSGAIAAQQIAGISLARGLQRDAVEGLALLLARDPTDLDAATAFESWDGQGIAVISSMQLSGDFTPQEEAQAPRAIEPTAAEPTPPMNTTETTDTTDDTKTLEAIEPPCSLDDDPIESLGDARADELRRQLRRLDAPSGCDDYIEACAETLEAADALVTDQLPDEAYRAVLVFTRHASGAAGLDDEARANAQASLRELCDGAMLQFTISRACASPDAHAEVRAAQVLLELGELAVPAVLMRLRSARDPERLAQLSAVVIAIGDRAVEPLASELASGGDMPSRVAIQLAGELQNPRLVDPLMGALYGRDAARRNDAARALVMIGRPASQVFIDALGAGDEGLVRIATHCLARLGHHSAVRPLVAALERALQDKRESLARDAMRALADIADSRAVEPLAEIAGRRDWLRRSRQQDLQLAAIGAIERIPGDAAEAALHQLRSSADSRVAERASQALVRRGPAGSRSRA